MPVNLRPLARGDLDALHALHRAGAGALALSAAGLDHALHDDAHDHGRRAVVAVGAGGLVRGCAGWVEDAPWLYGAPVVAGDDDAASALVAHLVARADAIGATRIRASAFAGEAAKQRALVAAGFAPAFAFVTVARPVRPGDGRAWEGAWRRVGWDALEPARLADVHNDTLAGVDNTTALSPAAMREALDAARTDRGATAAWAPVEADGAYVAFVHGERDRDPDDAGGARFVEIATIAVRAAARGRGLAAAIVDDLLARVAGQVDEVRALIASTNTASLALHAGRGFVERGRRTVYERVSAGLAEASPGSRYSSWKNGD